MREAITDTAKRTQAMLKTAMGPVISKALEDPSVLEIMVNPDGRLWIERHGEACTDSGEHIAASATERVVRLVGSHIQREVTRMQPIVSAELPGGGERFEGMLPPVVTAPCFAIRKASAKLFTLQDYVHAKTLTNVQAKALRHAVRSRQNILIVGGTSSGKTTLANALLHEISNSGERVLILEDTRELRCDAPDQVALRTQSGSVTLGDLVRSTLRLRPDRIIVGEVRGVEALDMLKAWNTGHPGGIATIHANSAKDGLHRLEQLVGEASAIVSRSLIASAIDVLVYISGRNAARRIDSIVEVLGLDGPESYQLRDYTAVPADLGSKIIPLNSTQPLKGDLS